MELGGHFIRLLRDSRPDRRGDALRFCTQCLHLLNDPFCHAVEGAAPSAMRRTDHLSVGVGKKDGGAVGRQDAQHHARRP